MADAISINEYPEALPQQFVVLFVTPSKASRLLASLASRLPEDIIPLPAEDIQSLYARGRPTVPVSGIVLCVPREQLSNVDRSALHELERILPIYSTCGQSSMSGREFFEMCRQVSPCVPRDPDRKIFHTPAIVSPVNQTDTQRLISLENVSSGGLFLEDPELIHNVSDLLQVRLLDGHGVSVQTEVRWTRDQKRPGEPLGYGCAFPGAQQYAVKKLLELAESAPTSRNTLATPRK